MHHLQTAPLTRGQSFTFAQLCDGYMACYAGRDKYQGMRLDFFVEFFGHKLANELDGDDVADALDALQRRGRLHYKGGARKREDSIVGTNEPLKPATINRYRASLAAALTWARKRRLMPKGWTTPVGETARLPEDNARTLPSPLPPPQAATRAVRTRLKYSFCFFKVISGLDEWLNLIY